MPPAPTSEIVIGVLGGTWRAGVAPWGEVRPWDGGAPLTWAIAADDRWHRPELEPAVRQRRVAGTPVVETRVRIPDGDAVQRVWATAEHGGLTLVELENDSPLPIAVALSGAGVRSARPPTAVPLEGIDLPAATVVFPIGHRARILVGLAHDGSGAGPLPNQLPAADQVARGWVAICSGASRLDLPDTSLTEDVVAERCRLALAGPGSPDDDEVAFLLGLGELVRMGAADDDDDRVPEVAEAVHRAARRAGGLPAWEVAAALDAAERLLLAAGEQRAVDDLDRVRRRIGGLDRSAPLPAVAPEGVRRVAWAERRLAAGGDLFPAGLPGDWLGQPLEVHGLPAGPRASVSFALRWHAERPAIIWEVRGGPIELRAPQVAPGWRSGAATGEALWPPPPGARPSGAAADVEPPSFG